jgi:hypothetical protein
LLAGTACFLALVGIIGWIGATKLERFLLGSVNIFFWHFSFKSLQFIMLLLIALFAKIGIVLLAILYQTKVLLEYLHFVKY